MLLLDLIVSLAANSVASRLFLSRNKILSFLSDAKPWPAFVLPWPNKVWCLNCFHTHSSARAHTHPHMLKHQHTHTHTAPSLYHHAHKTRIIAQTNANTHSDTNTASYFSSLSSFLSLSLPFSRFHKSSFSSQSVNSTMIVSWKS